MCGIVDLIALSFLNQGNFGDVFKAKLKSTKQSVAVKTCKMTLPEEQKRKFLQEGRILKQYDHPNIVKLIGICVQKQPIMIVSYFAIFFILNHYHFSILGNGIS